jgi:hypothetical protein
LPNTDGIGVGAVLPLPPPLMGAVNETRKTHWESGKPRLRADPSEVMAIDIDLPRRGTDREAITRGRDRGDRSEPRAIRASLSRGCPWAPRIAFFTKRAARKSGAIHARVLGGSSALDRPPRPALTSGRAQGNRWGRLVLPAAGQANSNAAVTWPAWAPLGSPTKPLRRCRCLTPTIPRRCRTQPAGR